MLDLGFWNSLEATTVRQRTHEIQAINNPTQSLIQQRMWGEIVKKVVARVRPSQIIQYRGAEASLDV